MDGSPRERGVLTFGQFRLDPTRRTLLHNGAEVTLTARLFDTLLYLAQNAGRLITRDELERAVWGGRVVEDGNLQKAISSLRKAIPAREDAVALIVTVPGRGFRFAAPVAFVPETAELSGPWPFSGADSAGPPAPAKADRPFRAGFMRSRLGPRAAALLILLGGLAAIGAIVRFGWRAEPPPLSIVVMPFRYLGEDRGQAYLADILTDDLTTYLTEIPGSLVIARSSADALNGRSAQAVGRALHVRYVVEGSIQADRDGTHVSARLIDANDGRQIWSAPIDAPAKGGAQALAELTHQMVSALDRRLMDAEVTRAAHERPNNLTALDQFFRARSLMDRATTLEDYTQAQVLFEAAVRGEPDFVEVLSSLGWLLIIKGQSFNYPSYAADLDEAKHLVAQALALAPSDPGALAAQGRLFLREGNYENAKVQFAMALHADPACVPALVGLALHAWFTGQPGDVIAPMQAALRIDPLGVSARSRYQVLGLAALFAGQAQQAAEDLLRADNPDSDPPKQAYDLTSDEETRLYLIAAYSLAGNMSEARRRYQDYSATFRHRTVWRLMTYFTPAQMRMPGFNRVAGALVAAGMPRFADETEDDGVAPTQAMLAGGNFTPTPRRILNAETISTAQMRQMLTAVPAPLILDVGSGAAAPASATMVTNSPADFTGAVLTPVALDDSLKTHSQRPIIIMSSGPFGVASYNLMRHLIALANAKLYWYRGGEEAWAAAGLPAEDRRRP
jgi:DNA-binding winged helix-turn-helix (wHTH) protein/TolB-like protein/Tfp pilus assembly protein PilF